MFILHLTSSVLKYQGERNRRGTYKAWRLWEIQTRSSSEPWRKDHLREKAVDGKSIKMQIRIQAVGFEEVYRIWTLLSYWPFKDEAQTALFKDPVRTAL